MSAPDRSATTPHPPVVWRRCEVGIVEWHAYRGRAEALRAHARELGLALPDHGDATTTAPLVLGLRPDRWWTLATPAAAAAWHGACADAGGTVDLSSAYDALLLRGPRVHELLARACRLDLAGGALPPGRVAATVMLQTTAVLAALPAGLLWFTPSSFGRHAREWLAHVGGPFGACAGPDAGHQDLIEGNLP